MPTERAAYRSTKIKTSLREMFSPAGLDEARNEADERFAPRYSDENDDQ